MDLPGDQPCAMCSAPSRTALDPTDLGRRGDPLPLCAACYDDERVLLHAMIFARATWTSVVKPARENIG